ncbi:hypothetical protein PoB_005274300 [Plakobranchus ocellatus]|uniref:Uncharacterized protein n=1 Tax=Plakobranchus ocellatus TaxID=259542 RepID=A0AAV4C4A4_9GAST|nr:hypothetical protein PoB_005274300 [Plakobranchus ocellatus]
MAPRAGWTTEVLLYAAPQTVSGHSFRGFPVSLGYGLGYNGKGTLTPRQRLSHMILDQASLHTHLGREETA